MATDKKEITGNKKGRAQSGVFRIQIFECVMAAVCITASLILAGMLIYHNAFPFGILEGILMDAILSAMGLMMLGLNKYFSFLPRNFAETIGKLLVIVVLLDFILIALLYFSRSLRLSLYYFVVTDTFLFLFLFFIKRVSGWTKGGILRNRVSLVIGKHQGQNPLLTELERQEVGRIGFAAFDHPNLKEYLEKADNIYLSGPLSKKFKDQVISYCVLRDKKVYIVPETYEIAVRKSEMTQVGDIPVFSIDSFRLTEAQNIIKRFCDVILSLIGALLSSPIMLYAVIRIKKEDGGPIFYRQARSGLNGKEFQVIKFRSMIVDAEKYTGAIFAEEGDPRITKIGKLMRSARIDEIPQFFNVLVGNMSIVGPRPERPVFVEEFSRELSEYSSRLAVKPGITGLAQVMGNYTTSAENKVKFDLVYIRNYSLWLDLKILLKTVLVVFRREQAEGFSKKEKKQNDGRFDPEVIFGIGTQPSAAVRSGRMHRIGKAVGVMLCCLVVIIGSMFLRYNSLAMTMLEAALPDETVQTYGSSDLVDGTTQDQGISLDQGTISDQGTGLNQGTTPADDLGQTPEPQARRADSTVSRTGTGIDSSILGKPSDSGGTTVNPEIQSPVVLSQADMEVAMSKINLTEKVKLSMELLSKLDTADLMFLEKLAEGGFTQQEKEAAKVLLYQKFDDKEVALIKEVYWEYVE